MTDNERFNRLRKRLGDHFIMGYVGSDNGIDTLSGRLLRFVIHIYGDKLDRIADERASDPKRYVQKRQRADTAIAVCRECGESFPVIGYKGYRAIYCSTDCKKLGKRASLKNSLSIDSGWIRPLMLAKGAKAAREVTEAHARDGVVGGDAWLFEDGTSWDGVTA